MIAPLLAVATLVLAGHVVDRTTGQPLPGVTLSAGHVKAVTDRAGAYRLRGVTAGKITIRLESDDVPPQSFEITVNGKTPRHDFVACSTTLDYSCAPIEPVPAPGS